METKAKEEMGSKSRVGERSACCQEGGSAVLCETILASKIFYVLIKSIKSIITDFKTINT